MFYKLSKFFSSVWRLAFENLIKKTTKMQGNYENFWVRTLGFWCENFWMQFDEDISTSSSRIKRFSSAIIDQTSSWSLKTLKVVEPFSAVETFLDCWTSDFKTWKADREATGNVNAWVTELFSSCSLPPLPSPPGQVAWISLDPNLSGLPLLKVAIRSCGQNTKVKNANTPKLPPLPPHPSRAYRRTAGVASVQRAGPGRVGTGQSGGSETIC